MLVSVIIPCYNVEDYIQECVESVVQQSYSSIEIICIDNNSTDQTLKILNELKQKYNCLILRESKKGAPAARNKGLLIAEGEWIQFLDADDLLKPLKIEKQINLLKHNRAISFIVGVSELHDFKGRKIGTSTFLNNVWRAIIVGKLGNTCANLFSKKVLLNVKGWDENLESSQEYNLMFELLKINSNILFDSNCLTIIRQRESGQISQLPGEGRSLRFFELRDRILKYLKLTNQLSDEIKEEYYWMLTTLSDIDIEKSSYYVKKHLKNYKPKLKKRSRLHFYLSKFFSFTISEKIRLFLKNIFRS